MERKEKDYELSFEHVVSAETGRWYDIVRDFQDLWGRIDDEISVYYGNDLTLSDIDSKVYDSMSEVCSFLTDTLSEIITDHVLSCKKKRPGLL